jgi:hypothetical protein
MEVIISYMLAHICCSECERAFIVLLWPSDSEQNAFVNAPLDWQRLQRYQRQHPACGCGGSLDECRRRPGGGLPHGDLWHQHDLVVHL